MPQIVEELIALLDLEQIDTDLFRGRQPETMLQRVFGGQVMAQALAAAYRTVPKGRTAHALTAHFLRPGDTGTPILYLVEGTKEGRSFSSRRVLARQQGQVILSMMASFHIQEDGIDHQAPVPVDLLAPDQCPTLAEVLASRSARAATGWDQEWGALDVRFVSESDSDQGPRMQVWVRADAELPDDPEIHQMVLAYASDLTLLGVSARPHDLQVSSPNLQAASLGHAMWFHRPARADEWLLYDQVSPSASNGLGFSFGRLFSGGQLVASCAQEGLIRIVKPVRS